MSNGTVPLSPTKLHPHPHPYSTPLELPLFNKQVVQKTWRWTPVVLQGALQACMHTPQFHSGLLLEEVWYEEATVGTKPAGS